MVNRSMRSGQLTLAVFNTLRFCLLSLWERTKVRVNFSWFPRPSPFPLPKGEGGIESTLLVT